MSKLVCCAALALLLLAVALLHDAPGQGQGNLESSLSQEQADLLRTLVAGLRHWEAMIHSVSGSVTVRTFYSDAAWIGDDDVIQKRHEGTLSDWDMAVIDFELGEQEWWYEVQMLRWAGGCPWFWTDPQRKARNVADLYPVVACDGQHIYRIDRSQKAPTGSKSRVQSAVPGYLHDHFGDWLGLGNASATYSDLIDPPKGNKRLYSVVQETVDMMPCYKVTYGIETPEFMHETKAWIAPEQDYNLHYLCTLPT